MERCKNNWKTQKLINICNELEANEYFTGPAAKNYIDEKRANQQIALEKAVFDQAIQNQQDLNAVYNRDQSLAGLLLDSGITFTDNVQTTSDLAQDRVVNQPITKDGIGSTIGIISVVAILAFLGSRYIK